MLDSAAYPLDNYELDDRYRRESGRVFLTGTQALLRIALMQRTMDKAAGLNTAGFVSGYRGSPLGGVDQELWRSKRFLEENQIEFLPAVNDIGVAYVPGESFYAGADQTNNIRLSYSQMTEDKIAEGIARLARLLAER